MHFFQLAVLVSFACYTHAFPATSPDASSATDNDHVLTPAGRVSKSNLHAVPPGGHILRTPAQIQLIGPQGNILHSAPRNNATGSLRLSGDATATTTSPPTFASGWIADANWYNNAGSPISSFISTWTVPAVPPTWHSQLLYIFNSLEPAAFNTILQPVLQYGVSPAGGGQYWSVSTWYLDSGNVYFTPLVQVSPGQQLQGVISYVSKSGSSFTYNSYFSNVAGAQGIQVVGSAELTWAALTLETYGVTASTDYPTGSLVFQNTNVQLFSTSSPSLSWATSGDAADGITSTVNIDGSVNAKATITFPNH